MLALVDGEVHRLELPRREQRRARRAVHRDVARRRRVRVAAAHGAAGEVGRVARPEEQDAPHAVGHDVAVRPRRRRPAVRVARVRRDQRARRQRSSSELVAPRRARAGAGGAAASQRSSGGGAGGGRGRADGGGANRAAAPKVPRAGVGGRRHPRARQAIAAVSRRGVWLGIDELPLPRSARRRQADGFAKQPEQKVASKRGSAAAAAGQARACAVSAAAAVRRPENVRFTGRQGRRLLQSYGLNSLNSQQHKKSR